MKINYAELYGVADNESDFSEAIKRSLNMGVMHLGENFIRFIRTINKIRKEE